MAEIKLKVDCLNVLRLPARIHTEQVAVILGYGAHDIPVLVRAKLLHPLGNPVPNSVKWFSAKEVIELSENREWLDKATKTVSKHWSSQNAKRRKKPVPHLSEEPAKEQAA